jgi:hypothetical protein
VIGTCWQTKGIIYYSLLITVLSRSTATITPQKKTLFADLSKSTTIFNDTKRAEYEEVTEKAFWQARPHLAWECIFPDGIDMEALSPRDVNARIRVKQQAQQKAKAPAAKLAGKEKDHPSPPPPEVREPPCSYSPNGATYQTGQLLGKGGFAICYEGQLAGTKRRYALKIVKSNMAQKKMEQKV